MATLTTRAVITAHDRLTGPLNAMAGRVAGINSRLQASTRKMGSTVANSGTSAMGAAFGLGIALNAAKDFERRMFGLGVSTIPDAMSEGKDAVQMAADAMGDARLKALGLSKELGQTMGNVGEAMEAGAKGGMGVDRIDDFTRSVLMLKMTDPEASTEGLANWAVGVDALYGSMQRASGTPWGEWMMKQADHAAVAAAETQLSVGTMISGVEQFQGVHAAMGVDPVTSAALLASGVKAGQGAVVTGQTLKSNALRVLVPTLPAMRAWDGAGLNRSDYFVGETHINDPMKVAGALSQLSGGMVTGKSKKRIQQLLLQAQREGLKATDARLQNDLMEVMGGAMGLNLENDDNRARIAEMISSTMLTGVNVDMEKLYKDLVAKGVDTAKIAQMFEGRRIAYNSAILSQIENGFYDSVKGKMVASDGKTLKNTLEVFNNSYYGRLERMSASVSRLNQRLMTSNGIIAFIDGLSGAIEKLDAVNPRLLDLGAQALLIGLAAGPILRVGAAVLGLGAYALKAASGMARIAMFSKRLMGGSFATLGRGAAFLATGLGALAMRGSAMAGFFGMLGRGIAVLARFAGPIGWITTGVWAAYEAWQNFSRITQWADSALKAIAAFFGFKIEGSPIGDAINKLMAKLQPLIEMIESAVQGVGKLFGGALVETPEQKALRGRGFSGTEADAYGSGWELPTAVIDQGNGAAAAARLDSAASKLESLPDRLVNAIQGVQVNVAGSDGHSARPSKAAAPSPRNDNGGQHNGGN